uniref:Non-structural protein NP-1 n=1 Tax=Canine minute virus TaxID=329639 RepID=A0A345CKH1_9VIRU|nr:NP1 [Canine minute virus]
MSTRHMSKRSKARSRSRSPQDSRRPNGERDLGSFHRGWTRNQSSSTVSRHSTGRKTTPMHVFNEHKSRSKEPLPAFCGFICFNTILICCGTDSILNEGKPKFQSVCHENKITWDQCREMLFEFKKTIDQKYRNIMYHMGRGGFCQKCCYWDDVYTKHLANVNDALTQDLSDADMLSAAMEVDGSSE